MTARMFTSGFCSRSEPPLLSCGHQRRDKLLLDFTFSGSNCRFEFEERRQLFIGAYNEIIT
jgi:hypothetical protein